MSNGSTSLRTLVTCHKGRCWFFSLDGADRFHFSTDFLELAGKSASEMLDYPTPPTPETKANRPFVRRYELMTSDFIQVQTLDEKPALILVSEFWMRVMQTAFEAALRILTETPERSFTAEIDARGNLVIRDADLRSIAPSAP